MLVAGCTFGSSGATQTGAHADGTSSAASTTGVSVASTGPSQGGTDAGSTAADSTGVVSMDSGDTDTGGCTLPASPGCPCQMHPDCERGTSCVEDVCTPTECGNGRLELGEACDDGNRVQDDGCEPDCQVSTGVAQVALGDEHTCARTHAGQVKCWGRGGGGRLGYGNTDDIGLVDTPADHAFVSLGAPVVDLCAGPLHSCVALADGDVRCWGDGGQGKLGTGSNTGTIGDTENPDDIDPIEIGGVALAVTCGSQHSCALLQGGDVRCWGNHQYGRLGSLAVAVVGDNEHPNIFAPVDVGGVATQVVAGGEHTCALLEGGDARCWGRATSGKLGNGTTTPDIGDDEPPSANGNIIDFTAAIVQLSAGLMHTCALLDDGAVKCWGEGGDGQLGYGDAEDVGDDETIARFVQFVSAGGAAVGVYAGGSHTCVVLQTNEVRCWGLGGDGRLGYGDVMPHLAAPNVAVNLGVGLSPRDMDLGVRHTCARVTGGQLVCFGLNSRGQLGVGNNLPVGDDEDPAGAGLVSF